MVAPIPAETAEAKRIVGNTKAKGKDKVGTTANDAIIPPTVSPVPNILTVSAPTTVAALREIV